MTPSRGLPTCFDAAARALLLAIASASIAGCNVIAGLDELDHFGAAESVDAASDGPTSGVDASETGLPTGHVEEPSVDSRPPPGSHGHDGADASQPVVLGGGTEARDASSIRSDGAAASYAERDAGSREAGDLTPDAAAGVADQDAGTWCASHASSTTIDCHDFDDGKPPQAGFASHYYSGHFSSVTSSDYAPGSAPASLLISTPSLDAGAQAQDEQFNDLLAYHAKVELSFALKIVDYDPNAGYVSLFRASYDDGAWAAELDFQQGGARFSETTALADGGVDHATYAAAQPSHLDEWTNVDCLFDFAGHTISLWYDGVPVMSGQTIRNPAQNAPKIFIQTGLNYLVAPAKPMMIYYDDILLGAPP